jgi:tRNA-uridine 2-sulfurtransferase
MSIITSNNKKIKVVVGLSGGVDSAVSASLLLEQGYDVTAVFMQNWDSALNNEKFSSIKNFDFFQDGCEWKNDYEDAKKIAKVLGIKLIKVNFVKEYWDEVFEHFISEYKKSRTPNPDILCNKNIKFKYFMKYAMDNLDADFIAMGHYANIKKINGKNFLSVAKDTEKDQTYFLSFLSQDQIDRVIFPIGHLTKKEVRNIALKKELPVFNKKDSTGICFIGERRFKEFLSSYIPAQPGDIVDFVTKKIVGKHQGAMYFTIGQSKGIGVNGQEEKYYVYKKDIAKKILYVVKESDYNKFLLIDSFYISEINLIGYDLEFLLSHDLNIKYRHSPSSFKGKLFQQDNKLKVVFENKQRAIAEGQYAVFYFEDICLGGAVIDIV